ncbi:MAG TPA: TetR/AcrR family transcriptional regulator [Rhizomicrobium sp.]|nr:TetR/AcrR family transcriptional regulator [Rhizomicrobium sp.]
MKLEGSAKALAELEPRWLAADGDGWQQRKSAQTRRAILDATIECLAKYGYSRTTTQSIAKAAEISRGAMLHHYATRQELIVAAIDYTFYKRMKTFAQGVGSLSDDQRMRDVAGVERYWESVLSDEFAAYVELSIAARTDAELRAVFLPKAQQYDKIQREEVVRMFPEWAGKEQAYRLAMDFCVAAIEGLSLNREIWSDETRQMALRSLVAKILLLIRDAELDGAQLR